MSRRTTRYAKGPSLDDSIGFTRKRLLTRPYTNMLLEDFPPYKALQELLSTNHYSQEYNKIWIKIRRCIIDFKRLRDKESPIGCYECEQDEGMSDFCHCGPECENCGDKYCHGCGFHREDFY
jgi:hypothetical protein